MTDVLDRMTFNGKVVAPQSTVPMGKYTPARDISVPTEIEDANSVITNDYKYKASGQRYMPVPSEEKYYDVENEETHGLNPEMVIGEMEDAIFAILKLREYPFVLVDYFKNTTYQVMDREEAEEKGMQGDHTEEYSIRELEKEYPAIVAEMSAFHGGRYEIITLSEVNRKVTKEMLYPIVSEIEKELALLIKEEYPKSEPLADQVGRDAGRVWEESKGTDSEVHISEFMNLTDMRRLISNSNNLSRKIGYSSSEESDKKLRLINDLRNKVMHANRPIARVKEDIQKFITQLENCGIVLSALDANVQLEIPEEALKENKS